MSGFFPRDVVQWGEGQLHPLRAFAIRTLEPAGLTGLLLRLFRAVVYGSPASAGLGTFLLSYTLGVVFLCGMLTWHLGNFPIRRWPMRVLLFALIETLAEVGMSSILIAFGRERIGSRVATWADWWPMAGQTLVERTIVLALFALVLALCVQFVRRLVDRREPTLVKRPV